MATADVIDHSTPRTRRAASSRAGQATSADRGRARRLIATEIEFVPNRSFHAPDAEATILGDRPSSLPAPSRPRTGRPLLRDMPAHLARLCEAELLSAEQERDLFRRMNFLKYRANSIRAALDPSQPDLAAMEALERRLAQANTLRDRIVEANLRLVMSIVKKYATPQLPFDELLSSGIVTLMAATNKFDYSRGFRFSTYAYRAVAQSAYRAIGDLQKQSARFSSGCDQTILDSAVAGRSSSMDERTWMTLRRELARMLSRLDRRERFILRGRFVLGAHRKVRTFQSLADRLGISKERVRQLEQRAVAKLREMAAETGSDRWTELTA